MRDYEGITEANKKEIEEIKQALCCKQKEKTNNRTPIILKLIKNRI